MMTINIIVGLYLLFVMIIILFFNGCKLKEKTEMKCQYCGAKINPVQITVWVNEWEGRCPKCNEIINWNLAKKESNKKHS